MMAPRLDPDRVCRPCQYGDHLNCPQLACQCERAGHPHNACMPHDVTDGRCNWCGQVHERTPRP